MINRPNFFNFGRSADTSMRNGPCLPPKRNENQPVPPFALPWESRFCLDVILLLDFPTFHLLSENNCNCCLNIPSPRTWNVGCGMWHQVVSRSFFTSCMSWGSRLYELNLFPQHILKMPKWIEIYTSNKLLYCSDSSWTACWRRSQTTGNSVSTHRNTVVADSGVGGEYQTNIYMDGRTQGFARRI